MYSHKACSKFITQSSVSVLAFEPVKTVGRFQHPLKRCTVEIGSALAVRVGEGEVNGFRHGSWIAVHMAATVVGCRRAWLALGGLFLFFFAQICIESASFHLG